MVIIMVTQAWYKILGVYESHVVLIAGIHAEPRWPWQEHYHGRICTGHPSRPGMSQFCSSSVAVLNAASPTNFHVATAGAFRATHFLAGPLTAV